MIKLESAHIEEVRGIRKLDIDFSKETFAISGPNGSGKSGVIDAIEFGLTGEMGRLAGRGTKGLSVTASRSLATRQPCLGHRGCCVGWTDRCHSDRPVAAMRRVFSFGEHVSCLAAGSYRGNRQACREGLYKLVAPTDRDSYSPECQCS
jgi:AAA domain